MADVPIPPDNFVKLKKDGKDGMKAQLTRVGLPVNGNKPNLIDRYKKWWNKHPGTPANSSSTNTAPATQTMPSVPLPSANDSTVLLLERLFAPAKHQVSANTLDCLKALQYTPSESFSRAPVEKDFSETLRPVHLFVDVFLKTMKQVDLTSELGENESALRCYLPGNISDIQASPNLKGFFKAWNIKVLPEQGRSIEGIEYDAQLTMALEASRFTARKEAALLRNTQDKEAKEAADDQKALSQELDIINCALQHRLTRWMSTFPQRASADHLWPTTFSTEERSNIRGFVAAYLKSHGLDDPDVSDHALMNAVKELNKDDDFPVEMARTTAVIQAAVLETRLNNDRRSRSQSQVTQTPSMVSRNTSPVKGLHGLPGSDELVDSDGYNDEGIRSSTGQSRKRSRRPKSTANRSKDIEESDEESDEDAHLGHQGTRRAQRRRTAARRVVEEDSETD